MAISLLAVVVLYLSGTPLVSLTNSGIESNGGTLMAVGVIHVRWPLLAACFVGVIGLAAVVWPQQRPPKIQ